MIEIEDVWAVVDHIAIRVTTSAAAGLTCGATFATLKGFPIFKTSASAALSCAMISTACFGMERLAHGVLAQTAKLSDDGKSEQIPPSSAILQSTLNPQLHYGSHALGGLFGGLIVGFLFKRKPLAGTFLLTPVMLGIGKIEISLEEYRNKRLQELIEQERESR
mmetsp:Transcript_36641/g.76889  ORF Transcript_36641/g.76889 Transcript_36641/m.76889 type:complete len:164 (-) Transcript_36641:358-849(-)